MALKNARAISFFKIGRAGNNLRSDPKNSNFLDGRLPLPESDSPEKFMTGSLTSSHFGDIHFNRFLTVGCYMHVQLCIHSGIFELEGLLLMVLTLTTLNRLISVGNTNSRWKLLSSDI